MNFFRKREHVWKIEREYPGQYHNSPAVWRPCGCVRAPSRPRALVSARRVVGVWGNVRVQPVEVAP